MRLQPALKARTPGANVTSCQPGIAANGVCWYLASTGRAGAAHCWHSAQAGQAGAVGAAAGGNCAQPAENRIAATGNAKVRRMWVIYIEMGVALAMLILIVWWTWPAKRAQRTGNPGEASEDQVPKEKTPK